MDIAQKKESNTEKKQLDNLENQEETYTFARKVSLKLLFNKRIIMEMAFIHIIIKKRETNKQSMWEYWMRYVNHHPITMHMLCG